MQHIDLAPPHRLVFGRHGTFLANLNDSYLGRDLATYGEHGEIELAALLQLTDENRDAVEVGANMGVFSVPLARKLAAGGRRLLAVEPQPVVHQQLCANIGLNSLFNVLTPNVACASSAGSVRFDTPNYQREGNFGGIAMRTDGLGTQAVPCVQLDDLLDDSWDVGVIKIDVEGFELEVLKGASQTIARCRPALHVENDRVQQSQALIEHLWGLGYQLWWHISPLFNPANFAGQAADIHNRVSAFNMIALPKEKGIPVTGAPEVTSATEHPLAQ